MSTFFESFESRTLLSGSAFEPVELGQPVSPVIRLTGNNGGVDRPGSNGGGMSFVPRGNSSASTGQATAGETRWESASYGNLPISEL